MVDFKHMVPTWTAKVSEVAPKCFSSFLPTSCKKESSSLLVSFGCLRYSSCGDAMKKMMPAYLSSTPNVTHFIDIKELESIDTALGYDQNMT